MLLFPQGQLSVVPISYFLTLFLACWEKSINHMFRDDTPWVNSFNEQVDYH